MSRPPTKTSAPSPLATSGTDPPCVPPPPGPAVKPPAQPSLAQELASVQIPRPASEFSVTVEDDPTRGGFCIRVAPASEGSQAGPPEPADAGPEALSNAAKLLKVLSALDPDNRLRKAPPIKVFNLYYRRRLAPAEIGRICHCHRSLIFRRLAAIRKNLPWTPQQLHELSPQVEAMQDALTDSQAAGIYRKGAVYGDEDSR